MKNKDNTPKFERCSVCGEKISFLRKIIAKRQDKKNEFELSQSQFCTPKCSKLGIRIISEVSSVKEAERNKFISLIEKDIHRVASLRQARVREFGGIQNIPHDVMMRLYPGSIGILNNIKKKLNETKRNQL